MLLDAKFGDITVIFQLHFLQVNLPINTIDWCLNCSFATLKCTDLLHHLFIGGLNLLLSLLGAQHSLIFAIESWLCVINLRSCTRRVALDLALTSLGLVYTVTNLLKIKFTLHISNERVMQVDLLPTSWTWRMVNSFRASVFSNSMRLSIRARFFSSSSDSPAYSLSFSRSI